MDRQGMASLKWLEFSNHILDIQKNIFLSETHFDVILKSEEKELKAHKCILSNASTFFETIFKNSPNETVTVLIPDVEYDILLAILTYIYTGESPGVDPSSLSKFLEASSLLKIKGLMSYGGNVNGIYIEGSQILEPNESIVIEEVTETVEAEETDESIEYLEDSEFVQYIDVIDNEDSSRNDDLEDENSSRTDEDMNKEEVSHSVSDPFFKIDSEASTNPARKQYDDTALAEALTEVKEGKTLKEIAAKYNIPRSTLYMKSKQYFIETGNDPKKSKYQFIEQAVYAIVNKEMSFHRAETIYNVPKSVLWRRVQKCSDYKSGKREVSAMKSAAIEAIQNGESLTTIANKYKLPISSLHREKMKLFNDGKLKNVQIKRQNKGQLFRENLNKAVTACKAGMSQASAAYKYKVPKTTIWRHLRIKEEPAIDINDQ